jgi:allantoinase
VTPRPRGADLLISARRVLTAQGIRPATVAVAGEVVSDILPYADTAPAGAALVELAGDEVLLPGLVDTHVHVNEPGRTDWEGFASATSAAAAGGVTTIIDMPLNSLPPTTDIAALQVKRAAAQLQCHVDVGFWAGAIPGNEADRRPLHQAGVFGFKCFMTDSGVPEFAPVDAAGLAQAATDAAELGSLLVVHAEDAAHIGHVCGRDYAAFLRSRPQEAETAAITRVVEVARRTGARVHILHLSAATALPVIAAARRQGLAVTAETCPHYLALAAEDIPAGATEFKCCPPIRDRANRELLWDGLQAGIIQCVVSDHSPCPPALKRPEDGDFSAAWGGISSLQLSLPVVWTRARERGCTLADVAGWMAAGPARLAGLSGKGAIAPGKDADLIAFAPDEEFTVDPGTLRHRHPVTPYAGERLAGVVRRTWLRGRALTGEQHGGQPAGRLLRPTGADDA